MELKDYVFDKETVHEQAEVYQGEESVTGKGTLACTSKRVVFVSGKEASDISINSVDAIEYSGKRYPESYLQWGGLMTVFGLLAFAITTTLDIPEMGRLITMVVTVAGIATLGFGLFLRRASLRLHTPNKTFNFTSREDLADMAHMIRAQESR